MKTLKLTTKGNPNERMSVSVEEEGVTFLYVPDIQHADHSHITLTKASVRRLAKFLNNCLKS